MSIKIKVFTLLFFSLSILSSAYSQSDTEYVIDRDKVDTSSVEIKDSNKKNKNEVVVKEVVSSDSKEEPLPQGKIYNPKKRIEVKRDDVILVLDGNFGTFCIYAVTENGKKVPLLSSYDNLTASYFIARFGKKEFKLRRENGIQTEARQTDSGAQMAYTIPDFAQIVLDFAFMPSVATSSKIDMFRVTVFAINLTPDVKTVELKGVFDTILGETTKAHFSTDASKRINSDTQLFSMKKDLWIRSSNERAAIQFLLDGEGISVPDCVTLTDKDSVSNSWIPSVQSQKSFNSVLSYNNSVMAINWAPSYLDPLHTSITTFYISIATDGKIPAGKAFLDSLARGKSALMSNSKPPEQTEVFPEPVPLTNDELKKAFSNSAKEIKVADSTPKKQLSEQDAAYVQELLNRIFALENTDREVDYEEIDALNREIDLILQKLDSE